MLDCDIPAEEYLTEEQIINLVNLEEREENDDDDDSNSDKEIPLASIKEAVSGLETLLPTFNSKLVQNSMLMICIFLENISEYLKFKNLIKKTKHT